MYIFLPHQEPRSLTSVGSCNLMLKQWRPQEAFRAAFCVSVRVLNIVCQETELNDMSLCTLKKNYLSKLVRSEHIFVEAHAYFQI